MIRHSSVVKAFDSAPHDILRENLISRKDLSINGFYLPPGQRLLFQETPGVERLHILLEGACRLVHQNTELRAVKGYALGVSAPGEHRIEAEDRGVSFVTLALRDADESSPARGDGITVMELLGPNRVSCRDRLENWARRPSIRNRVFLLHPERSSPGSIQVLAASDRVLMVLEGKLGLEVVSDTFSLHAPSVCLVRPDTPHRLLETSDTPTTVLVVSTPEPSHEIINHFSCGQRIHSCDLMRFSGDGRIHIDSAGNVIDSTGPIRELLGLRDGALNEPLAARLLPHDAQWLEEKLAEPGIGQPSQTTWASPAHKDLVLSVLFVPYLGEHKLRSAQLFLRPLTFFVQPQGQITESSSAIPEWKNFVALSPNMADIKVLIPKLASEKSWAVIWGPTGTGRTTVARLIHALGPAGHEPVHTLDCSTLKADALLNTLFNEAGEDASATPQPGPLLTEIGGGTLFLESLHLHPLSLQNQILKSFTRLRHEQKVAARVLVELDHRPQKGLPGPEPGSIPPLRGGFAVVELPPLRTRKADIAPLLYYFLKLAGAKRVMPCLSSDALELLLNAEFPKNIHDLNRLAHSLAATRFKGSISAGTLETLLELPVTSGFVQGETFPSLAQAEHELLIKALRQTEGNKAEAARILGISRARLYRMLAEHQLDT